MTRKLGWVLLVIAWSAIASAAGHSAKLSGYVRDTKGTAQMGADVEVTELGSLETHKVFTDQRGYFAILGLMPGSYSVRVTAPSFLPHLTENLAVKSGVGMVMNITLNTLFEAITLLPDHKQSADDQDDWKWTLRSMTNRPILRMVDGSPVVVADARKEDTSRGSVSFIAGAQADGFGSGSDYGTSFDMQGSIFNGGTIVFTGNVGYAGVGGDQNGVVRAEYHQQMADGSKPEFAIITRRFANPDMGFRTPSLEAVEGTASNTMQLTPSVEVHYGADMQTIEFAGREQVFRPFGTLDWHVGPNMVVEYSYATSVPNMRNLKGFDTAPTDLSETDPRVTMINGRGVVENAAHQEVSISRRFGDTSLQVAAYTDRVHNAELNGVGLPEDDAGDVVPDVFGGTFSYNGGDYSTNGMRIVFERKLPHHVTATFDYAFGGVLDLNGTNLQWDDVRRMLQEHSSQAVTAKITGSLPKSHTQWIASYRWMNGSALTPVDMFNTSPGQADPYFNIFVRQPLPVSHLIPCKMDAVIDVRNLLAQGYIPVMSQDGSTVFLVQSARSVRGGVSFTF